MYIYVLTENGLIFFNSLYPQQRHRRKFHHKLNPLTNRVGDKQQINDKGNTIMSNIPKNKLANRYCGICG